MGVKVGSCLHLSQPVVPHSPSSQTLASVISFFEQRTRPCSSSSSKRRCLGDINALVWGSQSKSNRSSLLGTRLPRNRSFENPKSRNRTSLRRSCSASFSDEEEELAKELQALRSEIEHSIKMNSVETGEKNDNGEKSPNFASNHRPFTRSSEPPWIESRLEPPEWPENITIPVSLERKANSVDLPLSLRIIKRKQWHERVLCEGFREASETACCSVKKAFSSMVFMMRELQSFTLRMRQFLFYEDLQDILVRVQKDMNASFVWLFQQVFSCTPTLMVYVMILLANFTVYSMGNNTAIAAMPSPESYTATVEVVESRERETLNTKFESIVARKFDFSGGGGGSSGKLPAVAGGADGDGQFDRLFEHHRTILPDEASPVSSIGNAVTEAGDEAAAAWEEEELATVFNVSQTEELKLWDRVVEEASSMQACLRDESLDGEIMKMFVSPISVEMESEDYYEGHFRTELLYQQAIEKEPGNPLLLSNYAQFLFIVVHDHDRAEDYFKRAVRAEPSDAETLSRYANFLWVARKDLTAAEETFLEAIAADPGNTNHAANYAHFLWNTGGEDTCYPLEQA